MAAVGSRVQKTENVHLELRETVKRFCHIRLDKSVVIGEEDDYIIVNRDKKKVFSEINSMLKEIGELIKKGADPVYQDKNEITALHIAAQCSDIVLEEQILPVLLDAVASNEPQAPILQRPDESPSKEEEKASSGRGKIGEKGIDVQDGLGQTPLFRAVAVMNFISVRWLIGKGANPDVPNKDGITPRKLAEFETVGRVVSTSPCPDGWGEAIEMIQYAMQFSGAQIQKLRALRHEFDSYSSSRRLEEASTLKLAEVTNKFLLLPSKSAGTDFFLKRVEKLIAEGANPSDQKSGKCTILHRVADDPEKGQFFFALLQAKNLDVNVQDEEGKTPLFRAIAAKNLPVIGFLLDKGADLDKQDASGTTPRALASQLGIEIRH